MDGGRDVGQGEDVVDKAGADDGTGHAEVRGGGLVLADDLGWIPGRALRVVNRTIHNMITGRGPDWADAVR